ncbi:MAG: DUF3429 domain-containing protein [Thiothrix sp.]
MKALPKVAWLLGYGGLIPFFALTLVLLAGDGLLPLDIQYAHLAYWLAAYAAVILSFLGAVHWGVVLGMQEKLTSATSSTLLVYSVIPAILAWFALWLPAQTALLTLAGLVLAAYLADRVLLFPHVNSNYAHLRLHLTVVVSLLLIAAAVAGLPSE